MEKEREISFDEKTQFNLGFRSGHAAGLEKYKFGWKQSKNFERSMSPKSNGFVKGFIRSQWRSQVNKITEIKLEGGRITSDQSRNKQISKRAVKLYDRDQSRAFKKYALERKAEFKRRGWLQPTKVNTLLKKEMKIKDWEMNIHR